MPELGDWNEWAKRVLGDIERIDTKLDKLIESLDEHKIELAVLKTKAAFVGVIAGLVVSIVVGILSTVIANKIGG